MITRVAAGEERVLTSERVLLLEPTSGTTGGEKLIPYTAGLRRQFQRGVSAWMADLFYHRPQVRSGRAYWSISPALVSQRVSPGGIPIGFERRRCVSGPIRAVRPAQAAGRAPASRCRALRCAGLSTGHARPSAGRGGPGTDLRVEPDVLDRLLSLLVDPDRRN